MQESDLLSTLLPKTKTQETNKAKPQKEDCKTTLSNAQLKNKKLVSLLKEKMFKGFTKVKVVTDRMKEPASRPLSTVRVGNKEFKVKMKKKEKKDKSQVEKIKDRYRKKLQDQRILSPLVIEKYEETNQNTSDDDSNQKNIFLTEKKSEENYVQDFDKNYSFNLEYKKGESKQDNLARLFKKIYSDGLEESEMYNTVTFFAFQIKSEKNRKNMSKAKVEREMLTEIERQNKIKKNFFKTNENTKDNSAEQTKMDRTSKSQYLFKLSRVKEKNLSTSSNFNKNPGLIKGFLKNNKHNKILQLLNSENERVASNNSPLLTSNNPFVTTNHTVNKRKTNDYLSSNKSLVNSLNVSFFDNNSQILQENPDDTFQINDKMGTRDIREDFYSSKFPTDNNFKTNCKDLDMREKPLWSIKEPKGLNKAGVKSRGRVHRLSIANEKKYFSSTDPTQVKEPADFLITHEIKNRPHKVRDPNIMSNTAKPKMFTISEAKKQKFYNLKSLVFGGSCKSSAALKNSEMKCANTTSNWGSFPSLSSRPNIKQKMKEKSKQVLERQVKNRDNTIAKQLYKMFEKSDVDAVIKGKK